MVVIKKYRGWVGESHFQKVSLEVTSHNESQFPFQHLSLIYHLDQKNFFDKIHMASKIFEI